MISFIILAGFILSIPVVLLAAYFALAVLYSLTVRGPAALADKLTYWSHDPTKVHYRSDLSGRALCSGKQDLIGTITYKPRVTCPKCQEQLTSEAARKK